MYEQFQDLPFRDASLMRIHQANEIIAEYLADGLKLTLRQLYYQFVARGLIPNKQAEYDKLGRVISNGRLAGLIDWDAIEDRDRYLRGVPTWESPSARLKAAARGYAIDMWANQSVRVEVWVEKNALVGVIEGVCARNYIDYFGCKGYMSQSALYEAGQRMANYFDEGVDSVIVVHMGDHDPSGIDMTRDNEERLRMFSRADEYGHDLEIRRVALNMDQVRRYNPPPNPAKLTDSRVGDYLARYGSQSWELDALEPRILRNVIQEVVDEVRDVEAWQEREDLLEKHRDILKETIDFAKGKEAE